MAEDSGPFITAWIPPELIEAAVRSGNRELADAALERLTASTTGIDTDWAAGIELRCRALLADGAVAEAGYREAIVRLARTLLRPELTRAHLLYCEWLRQQNRMVDAREQLRTAFDMFAALGAEGFAERARRELLATGDKVRSRDTGTRSALTVQEQQIARLARDRRSNPEIGAELFISVRTVEWHLSKVSSKLGISSRKALHEALPRRGEHNAA